MILVLLFVVFFVGGPLIFRTLTRSRPAVLQQRKLAIITAVLAVSGLALRYGFAEYWGRSVLLTVLSIALIWFAWIGVLAYGAQALRLADSRHQMRRWTGVIGAAGTTMPWFGLASANMVQG
ncbi:hypothetical protein Z946_1410 [Sulfitobacter noctilucicola]|uniref:Uncharacterized protein n=1 Tax=Sulfitobacter noctilucicola TaxID=1342301 RepID=A0A7W6M5M7_9RHOB|nr:hypothetical protein [Sulfitobacter noctilucicola]KIN62550.1 hypothetical protein Z946_1410 [Sulfitobacter noctilucicola]MBB4172920.1 hypothetical protein [Sulfitobacter noctilucicola]